MGEKVGGGRLWARRRRSSAVIWARARSAHVSGGGLAGRLGLVRARVASGLRQFQFWDGPTLFHIGWPT
jgi:hypothetical protein